MKEAMTRFHARVGNRMADVSEDFANLEPCKYSGTGLVFTCVCECW